MSGSTPIRAPGVFNRQLPSKTTRGLSLWRYERRRGLARHGAATSRVAVARTPVGLDRVSAGRAVQRKDLAARVGDCMSQRVELTVVVGRGLIGLRFATACIASSL